MGKKTYAFYALIGLGAIGLIGGGAMLAPQFMQGSVTPDGPQTSPGDQSGDEEMDGPWMNRDVKKDISLQTKQNDAITSGTVHIFSEKPTDNSGNTVWDNPRTIEPYFGGSEEVATIDVSSESVTFQDQPGTYYVVVESDGRYMNFGEITLPDGSSYESPLTEYNQAPESTTYTLADKYSPSAETVDLGVDSATSSVEEWSGDTTIRPGDGEEYRPWKLVVHTGDVDMTTDSDSDGNHDEGIQKAYFELSGTTSESFTVFNPNNGIDRLGSNDKAELDLEGQEVVVTEDEPLTVTPGVVTFETDTGTASDGDEVLTDGENPFDFQLFDESGTGTSMFDVTA
jgi:hypothetical protein